MRTARSAGRSSGPRARISAPGSTASRRASGAAGRPVRQGYSVKYVGREVPQPPPCLTLDALNHPHLRVGGTGERPRHRRPLAAENGLRAVGPLLPGAAKIPAPGQRPVHDRLGQHGQFAPQRVPSPSGGTAVDMSSEMVLFAEQLGRRSPTCWTRRPRPMRFAARPPSWPGSINENMWDADRGSSIST